MKKLLTITLALMLSLSLVACEKEEEKDFDIENLIGEENYDDLSFNEYVETLNPYEKELVVILRENRKTEVGTAGSSLKAVGKAITLIGWSVGSEISDEQVAKITDRFMMSLSDKQKEEYVEGFNLVFNTAKEILSGEAQGLIDDAGYGESDLGFPTDGSVGINDRLELLRIVVNR